MAIVTSTLLVPNVSPRAGTVLNHLKNFLVAQAGWTVAGSSNGVAGGMDAVDRPSDMLGIATTTNKWFVLQSPHAAPADRIQILYSGSLSSAADAAIHVAYNPQADYADNGLALPTSAYDTSIVSASLVTNAALRYHFLCDTDPPYGFACFGTTSLNTAVKQGAHALIPLDTVNPLNPGKPYVCYAAIAGNTFQGSAIGGTSETTTLSRGVAEPPNPPQVPFVAPGATLSVSTGDLFPNGLLPDSQNRDVSSPMIFQHANYFYGVSTFIRWNGTPRHHLDTLSDGVNPRARICVGDVNLPWDGITPPLT